MQIRAMQLSDIGVVVRIERSGQPVPWSEKQFEAEVNSIAASKPIVAIIDGVVVGFAVAWHVADEISLTNIGIEPTFRKRGIATKLLGYIFCQGENGKFRRIHLEVRRNNLAAIALYHKLGFQRVGIRPKYYADNGEDALLMAYDLPCFK